MSAPRSPEEVFDVYREALAGKVMSEAEKAIPAQEWPTPMRELTAAERQALIDVPWPVESLERMAYDVRYGLPCDDDDTEDVPTPELDAIDELCTAISAARAQLGEPIAALQLRRDEDLPATRQQRDAVRSAVWALRVEVARVLFALAPELAP